MSKFKNETAAMKAKIKSFPDVTMLLKAPAVSVPSVVIQVQNKRNKTAKGEQDIENTLKSSNQEGRKMPMDNSN
jgi:hypothetical protein